MVDQQFDGRSDPGPGMPYVSEATIAVTFAPPSNLRAEFGAHLEATYPRLVAQLCMITLDAGQAQELVQDAYARAWQRWSGVRELPDPTGWIRALAVRSSANRWRRLLRLRRPRPAASASTDPDHVAVLEALAQLTPHRRRALVLSDVAHLPIAEVARVEDITAVVAEARVLRGRDELARGLAARPSTDPAVAAAWEQM